MTNRSGILFSHCALLSLTLLVAGASAQTKTNIAVSDLVGQGVDASSAIVISDRLRGELFNTNTVTVLERSQMQQILKEQGFQQSGCTSDQCAVETGQLLGVKYMVVGSIGLVGHTYTLASRLIDVSTGKMVANANVDCKCDIDDILSRSTVEMARKLVQSFSSTQSNETPKPAVAVAAPPAVPQHPAAGSLRITTDPAGAKITVDSTNMGLTPFAEDTVAVGSHKIIIELAGYEAAEADISVSSGQTVDKKFDLHHTKAWKDSVESARRAAKAVQNAGKSTAKKHSIAPKIVFGVLAVGSGAAGLVFNNLEQKKLNDGATIKQQYVGSGYSNTSNYQGALDSDATAVKNLSMMRNICYVASGVCLVGFAVSFAF